MPTIPPRVLLVEDDEDSRVMLSTLFKFSDLEVKAVAAANEALSLMQEEPFDLYMLDAWLPDLDGFELCRRIRKFDPRARVVFYSGAGLEEDIKEGLDAGASAYVIKPDIMKLLETVIQLSRKEIAAIPPRRTYQESISDQRSQTAFEPIFVQS